MRPFSCYISLSALLLGATCAEATPTTPIGSAVAVVNDVKAAYARDRRDLNTGDRVHRDEMIEVGADSRGELRLDDDTKLALGPGSRLLLDKFVYDSDRPRGEIAVNLVKGVFRFVSGAAAKSSYRIKVPGASITVRGTIFDTFISALGDTWVLLIEGALRICTDQGVCRNLDQPGRLLRITNQGNIGNPVRWASLPGRDAVGFDTAFPFVGSPPLIDPSQTLTRQAVILGVLPRPTQRADRPKDPKGPGATRGGRQKDAAKPKKGPRKEPTRRASRGGQARVASARSTNQQAAVAIGLAIGFGAIRAGRGGRTIGGSGRPGHAPRGTMMRRQ